MAVMRTCSSVVAAASAANRASAARTRAEFIQAGAGEAALLCGEFRAGSGVTAKRIAQSAPLLILFGQIWVAIFTVVSAFLPRSLSGRSSGAPCRAPQYRSV